MTELGHTTISQTGPACSCGQHGHAEALVSGAGIRWQYRRLTGRRETTVAIAERARRGERAARQTFTTTAAHLATLMVNIIHTINPDCIVVGGGLGVLPQLTDVAFRLVRPRLLYPALRTTRLSRSTLGLDAGILGAAAQASGLPGRFRSRPLPRQVGRGHQGRSAPSGIGSADHSFPLAPPSRRPSAGGLPGRFRSRVRR